MLGEQLLPKYVLHNLGRSSNRKLLQLIIGESNSHIIITHVFLKNSNHLFPGHMPQLLAMIGVNNGTPYFALMLRGVISIILLLVSDGIQTMVNFLSFLGAFEYFLATFSLIVLRMKK